MPTYSCNQFDDAAVDGAVGRFERLHDVHITRTRWAAIRGSYPNDGRRIPILWSEGVGRWRNFESRIRAGKVHRYRCLRLCLQAEAEMARAIALRDI